VTGERVQRRLAAVLAVDVAGYSRLMGADEVGTLEALKAHRREVVDPAVADHNGRIVKTTGDGMLVEFSSAVDAVTCAILVQDMMAERNRNFIPAITFRIGINVGDIIIDGNDIFGDGVNVAARVENECEPGGVCLSGNAFEQVRGKTEFAFDDLGERSLKNIDRPVRLYAARSAASSPASSAKPPAEAARLLALPDRPSIAVLPFDNMGRLATMFILAMESRKTSSPNYRDTPICLLSRATRPSRTAARQFGLLMSLAISASVTSSKAA
jgi:adenylate cyclase